MLKEGYERRKVAKMRCLMKDLAIFPELRGRFVHMTAVYSTLSGRKNEMIHADMDKRVFELPKYLYLI